MAIESMNRFIKSMFLPSSLLFYSIIFLLICERPVNASQFSEAMTDYRPLAKVIGGEGKKLTENISGNPLKFSKSIEYAESLDSYSLLVWHQGAIVLEKYFLGYDKSLRSDTASMHKSVVALLVAAAIDDGAITSVNDPIKKYLPEWSDRAEGDITIYQLLTMSSGLKGLSTEGGDQSPNKRFYMGVDSMSWVYGLTLNRKPGSYFQYANVFNQLLGLVLTRAVKEPYENYLSERLWKRIGCKDAYVWLQGSDGMPRTYTALLARPRDWLRLGLLVKDRGRRGVDQVISASLIDQMTSSSKTNPNYGWQIWLGNEYQPKRYYNGSNTGVSFSSSEPFLAKDMMYFDGFGGQRVYISRSQDLVIVRTGDPRLDWDDSFLPNQIMSVLNH